MQSETLTESMRTIYVAFFIRFPRLHLRRAVREQHRRPREHVRGAGDDARRQVNDARDEVHRRSHV